MGTRSLTHIKSAGKKSPTLVTIYKQFDGDPTGLGHDLSVFLKKVTLCNGYTPDYSGYDEGHESFYANGPPCLAAHWRCLY